MLYGSVSSALAALPTRGEVIVVDDHSVTPAAKILEGFETDLEQGLILPETRGTVFTLLRRAVCCDFRVIHFSVIIL